LVQAKGKGVLKAFFVTPHNKAGSQSAASNDTGRSDVEELQLPQDIRAQSLLKREREVDWVTETLLEYIREIVAQQQHFAGGKPNVSLDPKRLAGHIPLDEVVDAIKLPEFNAKAAKADPKTVKIPDNIKGRLRQYVSIVR